MYIRSPYVFLLIYIHVGLLCSILLPLSTLKIYFGLGTHKSHNHIVLQTVHS